jgi:DNA polymerase-3 subunit gamma/tau
LEQGVVQISSVPVQTEAAPPQEEKPQAPRIVPKAVPEDIKNVIKNWNRIFSQCSPVEQVCLGHAKRTLGANGELVLQFTDPTEAGMFEQDSGRRVEELKTIICNAIDKEVEISVRVVSQQENNQYEDIGNVIHFEGIEVVE